MNLLLLHLLLLRLLLHLLLRVLLLLLVRLLLSVAASSHHVVRSLAAYCCTATHSHACCKHAAEAHTTCWLRGCVLLWSGSCWCATL